MGLCKATQVPLQNPNERLSAGQENTALYAEAKTVLQRSI